MSSDDNWLENQIGKAVADQEKDQKRISRKNKLQKLEKILTDSTLVLVVIAAIIAYIFQDDLRAWAKERNIGVEEPSSSTPSAAGGYVGAIDRAESRVGDISDEADQRLRTLDEVVR